MSIYADFIGMTFGSTNQAETVLEAMGVMRRKALLGLDEAVVVACDPKGQISLRSEFDPTDAEESAARSLLMLLVQAIAEAATGGQALQPGVTARTQTLATYGLDTVLVEIRQSQVKARLLGHLLSHPEGKPGQRQRRRDHSAAVRRPTTPHHPE